MEWSTLALSIATLIGIYIILLRKRKPKNYPPGPGWGLPVLGHMARLGTDPHKTFIDWKKKYGPIVAFDFGSFPAVAISDHKLIRETLGDIRCAGRPDLPMFKDRSGGVKHGILFSDGDEWVEIRRFTLRQLRDFGFGKKSMETILHDEVSFLVERLKNTADTPLDFRIQLNTTAFNSIWRLIASERFEHDDPKVHQLLSLLFKDIQENDMFSSLASFTPWMATYFPKISGYSEILKDLELFLDFLREALKSHRESFTPGQPRDLMDAYIEETTSCTDPKSFFYGTVGERVMLTVFLDLFLAGGETTTTTMTWFGLYLAAFPTVQEKLYQEILKVVGKSRLPSLEDKPSMPYTEAVTLEMMRMSSLTPMGLFHSTMADVELGGYSIPKDTMLITNLYSCHYDPEYWGDPQVFRPERFLSPDGQTVVRHEAMVAFSAGKRVCLGENLARAELFLFGTTVCQQFRFGFDPDNCPASIEAPSGFILSPPPHKLIFSERG